MHVSVCEAIMVVQSLPKFERTDSTTWIKMTEAVFMTAEGVVFLERFNNVAGLSYLYGHFTEEDHHLNWIHLTGIKGDGKTLLVQCSVVW